MAETSTLQRTSNLRPEEELAFLLEGKNRPNNTERMGLRNPTSHVPLDSLGSQSVPYPTSRRNVFLSYHRTDEPLTPVAVGVPQHQISNAWSLIVYRLVVGSDYSLVWHHSNDRNLQGRVPASFRLHARQESSAPTNVLVNVDVWYTPIHNLTERQEEAADRRGQERLAARLQASFEVEPVEDGMGHLAEEIIGEALLHAGNAPVLFWFGDFCTDSGQPSFAASVLRCLGRHDDVGTTSWRVGLVRDGLAMDSVEIRDAAVQAAESWGAPDFIEVLQSHTEPESWLQQYIFDVVEDLAK